MTDATNKPGFFKRLGGVAYRFFFMIGIAAFISAVFLMMSLSRLTNFVPPALPDTIVLSYTFKAGLDETVGKPSFDQPLLRPAATLREVIVALDDAAKDKRVKGFVAKIENVEFSLAQAQEIRAAIARFRAAGKFAHVFSDSYGAAGPGMGAYYLAAAFDEIWLQPVGVVSIAGVGAEVPYFKSVFDKIGIAPQFVHKGIYKSAPESLTETGMTAPTREMMTSLVNDAADQITGDIAADRKFTRDAMQALVAQGLFTDKQAQAAKLIDHLGYYDDMVRFALKKAGATETKDGKDKETAKEAEDARVDLLGYSFISGTTNLKKGASGFVSKFMRKEAPPSAHKDKSKIALIYGVGEIVPYKGQGGSFGEPGMSATKIVAAFESAREDKDVVAVVFRVDSPGGSPAASETIRRAVIETQKAGKPVVVSMASAAASGGYWISTPADVIVAQGGTLTGSIGVFGGKIVAAELWEKLGVNWETIVAGDKATMWSPHRKFSDAELAAFDAMLSSTYDAFLIRVMEGRKMTRAEAEAVAEGRVFTGRQALEKKLVDKLGGLDVAVAEAKRLAKLDENDDVPVMQFPGRKSTLELFLSLATEGALFKPQLTISAEDFLSGLQRGASAENGSLKSPLFLSTK